MKMVLKESFSFKNENKRYTLFSSYILRIKEGKSRKLFLKVLSKANAVVLLQMLKLKSHLKSKAYNTK